MFGAGGVRQDGAGLGEHLRFEDDLIVGGTLAYQGDPLHTVAYVRSYGEEDHVH